ncbi:Pimeloyl-ACP methyl ester carboxylesterase [Cupriavidus sp. YR651]|uniref:alpha/beta fold hydrolase n=1 Tax=Cupriavidus sp. YR651 TaxID=1855315 RepID=UPI0008899A3C|nr:alpha/beta fold hydrolase [Cupriavidus sp. YR651]SDC98525.1 Pimeloyl-ACP methyl ester carboxylesterase [Cupriavidus sp. YR651]
MTASAERVTVNEAGVANAASAANAANAAAEVEWLMQQATTFITDAGGCRIVWRRFGSGPAVLLVHGGHGSWLHWVRNIEALAARHTVWAPDLPGYGESGDPADGALQSLIDAVVAGFAELPDTHTVDLVGFSFGGLTASHLASQLPGVRRLALLGPGGHGGVRRQQTALVDWRRAEGAEALTQAMRHNVEAFMIADPASVDALALLAYTESCRHARFRSKHISRAGGLADALDRFDGPVLVAYGEHDVTADPRAVLDQLVTGRPDRRGAFIPGAGHWVQYEAHDAINTVLGEWLA